MLFIVTDIPNVLAESFQTSKAFAERLFEQTKSAPIAELLKHSDEEWAKIPQKQICYELLVELLAFQFASPVRWIETQNLLFGVLRTELLIEIGPAPTLFTMAKRTLESFDALSPFVQRDVMWYNRDKSKIYFEASSAPPHQAPQDVAVAQAPHPVAAAAPLAQVAFAASTALLEEPPSAQDFIQVLVALKVKQPLASLAADASLKSIAAGKSALQNELQGEVEAEFESSKAALQQAGNVAELPLTQLGALVQPQYSQPGKRSLDLVGKSVARALPGGFSAAQARSYLARIFGISTPNRQHNVLVLGASMEPPARLSSPAAAEEWLGTVAALYSSRRGISLQHASQTTLVAVSPSASVAPALAIPDEPPSPSDVIRTIVAIKMKKPFDSVAVSANLKDLAAGKSALQNEVVGDLAKEFALSSEPNGVTEMDLQTLATALTSKQPYSRLGPISSALVARFISSKMPAGFSMASIRSYLRSQFGLGDGRTESVLLRSLTSEPPSRIATEGEARSFWDSMASSYAKQSGIALSTSSAAAVHSAAGVVDTQIRSDLQVLFERQIRALQSFVDPSRLGSSDTLVSSLRNQVSELEASLRLWNDEHGGASYIDGLAPMFDSRKERVFDSFWAWVRQDCLSLFYDYACGRAPAWNLEVRNRIYHIKNRSTPEALKMVEYYKSKSEKDGFPEIVRFITMLHEALSASLTSSARYRELLRPQKPMVSVDSNGALVYREVDRPQSKDMIEYVEEMSRGRPLDLDKLSEERIPFLFVQKHVGSKTIDSSRTDMFFSVLRKLAVDGIGFTGKVALVTGCGEGSIGLEVLKALLSGGATVYATTSRFDGGRVSQLYQQAYNDRGAKGSRLILLPFNQASKSDIDNLIERSYFTLLLLIASLTVSI